MSKREMLWIVFALLLSCSVVAQQAPVTPNTLWAGGDGKFESAPDTALVQFTISVQETNVKSAYAKAQQSTENIRNVLRQNGLEPKDAEIGSFSMSPVYGEYPKRKIVGFQVNSQVTIKVHQFEKLGSIIESFSQIQAAEEMNLSYTLENMDSAKAKAVADAFQKAHNNAEALAHAAGRGVGGMSYGSVDVNEVPLQPRPMMMKANTRTNEASPVQEFAPGKITVTAHVNALFLLK